MSDQINMDEIILPLEPSYTWLVMENLSVLVVFVGTILLFKYSRRPGTLAMMIGVAAYLILGLAIIPFMKSETVTTGIYSQFIVLWPNLAFASVIASCIGFLRFSWSFKNES